VNVVKAATMALAYGGAANIFWQLDVMGRMDFNGDYFAGDRPGARYGIDISGYPIIILGAALLAQSLISIWTLILIWWARAKDLKSFSSNPVVNALYMMIMSTSDRATKPAPMDRSDRQSAHQQVPTTRVLTRVVWVGFAVYFVGLIVNIYYAAKWGSFSLEYSDSSAWGTWGIVFSPVALGTEITDWAGKFEYTMSVEDIVTNPSRSSDPSYNARLPSHFDARCRHSRKLPQRRRPMAVLLRELLEGQGHIRPQEILVPLEDCRHVHPEVEHSVDIWPLSGRGSLFCALVCTNRCGGDVDSYYCCHARSHDAKEAERPGTNHVWRI
jgi:hypothetical protein